MKILVVRGAFLNIFEMQSYVPLKEQVDIRAIGSHRPIHTYVGIPTTRFFSPYDLGTIGQSIPLWPQMIRAVANRTIGDPHFLLGLERYVRENGPFDIAHGAETYYGYDLQLAKLKKEGM
ncbi:MAG: hypothetical protein UZ21_OP11001000970 [Microgenomates bacterium OLB22]|nr:MAG: hypothetical protein UZ21_OP11001000970 [Microgenomates bacterium OLB22]